MTDRGFLGGRVFDGLVSHLDIYPTICELAGIAEPPSLHGTSLMPLVRGETGGVNDVRRELTDLSASPAHQQTRTDLRERLLEWMRATEDPLLDGPVPEPPGASSNGRARRARTIRPARRSDRRPPRVRPTMAPIAIRSSAEKPD